ncbi:MAG: choice-of-anchor E domain-containing protein [Methanotrichaceae archaeon]|nr:choice-of-anchor E domain-containing protein [Methanotrichaceae archaeon]
MKTIKWILLVAFVGLIFAPLAAAETITVSDEIPFTPTDWTLPACVDKFDPSLGTLTKVIIEMETCGFEDYLLDSEDSSAQVFIKDLTGWTETTLPNGDIVRIDLAPQHYELSVEADDEPGLPADFVGDDSDGFHAEDCSELDPVITYTDAANLAFFTGAGQACFSTAAKARNIRDGSANVEERVDAEIKQIVTVTYEYELPLFCIRGHKFNSLTGEGLGGWLINLKDASGDVIDTKTTNPDGSYEFCELPPGIYEVCEVMKTGWKSTDGVTCISVPLDSEDSEDNDFMNEPTQPPCGGTCPWFIKNELYTAQCGVLKEVPAEKGILANDPQAITVVDPESITIDPKYGTLDVYEDGSFDYDPSPSIRSGTYVIFRYTANNGACDAKYPGTAKIQVACCR